MASRDLSSSVCGLRLLLPGRLSTIPNFNFTNSLLMLLFV